MEKFENLTPVWFEHFVAACCIMDARFRFMQFTIDSAGNILWNGDIFSGNLINVVYYAHV